MIPAIASSFLAGSTAATRIPCRDRIILQNYRVYNTRGSDQAPTTLSTRAQDFCPEAHHLVT